MHIIAKEFIYSLGYYSYPKSSTNHFSRLEFLVKILKDHWQVPLKINYFLREMV